jgi:hypothetical protein
MALGGKLIMHRSIQLFQIDAEVNAEVGQIEASEVSRAAVSNKTFPGVARRLDFLLTPCVASEYVEFREIADLKPASGNRIILDFSKRWKQ